MKKGSGTADSECFLKFTVKVGQEYQRKFISFSVLKFEYYFKTLTVYCNNCLWLSVLYINKSKIVCGEDYIFRCLFPHYGNFFELKMCMYYHR